MILTTLSVNGSRGQILCLGDDPESVSRTPAFAERIIFNHRFKNDDPVRQIAKPDHHSITQLHITSFYFLTILQLPAAIPSSLS